MIIRQFQPHPFSFFTFSSKPISHFNPVASRSLSLASEFKQPEKIEVENHYEDKVEEKNEGFVDGKVKTLKEKIEVVGIHGDFIFTSPGKYLHLICPKCKGGQSVERSLSFYINPKTEFAFWRCFRVECGWAGQVFLDDREARKAKKKSSCRRMTEENLLLEPLGHELTAYFSERLISEEVLQKNGVMQLSTDKNVIAFTYRRNGLLVNCKYRSVVNKKFWQEKGAEKILYGLDDIKDADEIIIVEGEMDKLSMEQAGLTNSVSVPGGAPQRLSTKELPSLDKDSSFPYLWNCKEYLDKASKIILATDGDGPGQVLAEELARRLGRERCWLVSWPKKDDFCCFKDANEVLTTLGADALRDVVKNAVLYRCKT